MGNNPSSGPYLERQFSAASGKDVDTIHDMYSGFQKDCPSGYISPQQFTDLYERVVGTREADEFRNKAFGQFDKHNNGTINFRDFLMVIQLTSNGSAEDKLRTMFSLYDLDGNKTIDAEEMSRYGNRDK